MPSSDYNSIPKVLQVVERVRPRSILDIGMGHGRYGFLFREILDWNYGRMQPIDWMTVIDAVEVEESYVRPYHEQIYDKVVLGDWIQIEPPRHYNLIFMGDVLEHWANGEWQKALEKANSYSDVTLVVCPNHAASLRQGAWRGHEHERHLSLLSPEKIGGRCLYASSKIFMVGFDNRHIGILDGADVCP